MKEVTVKETGGGREENGYQIAIFRGLVDGLTTTRTLPVSVTITGPGKIPLG